jgi:hypothetical protein
VLASKRMRWFDLTSALVLAVIVAGAAPVPASLVGSSRLAPAIGGPGLSAPVATAAAVNTTAITVTWTASTGTVTNYSVTYARFYGLPIANLSAGTALVYNVTNLGFGLTYYFVVTPWNGTTRGPASNVAAAQTDPLPPIIPPFPWSTLTAVTMLSILGSLAFSAVIASLVAGRRSRRAEGTAAIALSRTRPRDTEAQFRARPARRAPPAR